MKETAKIRTFFILLILASAFFTGCSFGKREFLYNDDIPVVCEQMLEDCFGENCTISKGREKEEHFFDEFEHADMVTHYTEWTLTWTDADGQEREFVFNNRNGRMSPQEHIEKSMENYFCDLVQQYYRQNFWNEAAGRIPGFREDDSVLYFQSYRLFSMPDVPETKEMFQKRLHYSLSEHISFPRLQYDNVFRDFPYILNMYLYIDYKEEDEAKRKAQRLEAERRLREMTDEMIQYTGCTLNATIHITMMDENGYADGFSFAVLCGEYFPDGPGLEFELALQEKMCYTMED